MIGGLFFLASIIAIFIVLRWFTQNDAVPEDSRTTGWLAMRLPADEPVKKVRKRWTREDALRR